VHWKNPGPENHIKIEVIETRETNLIGFHYLHDQEGQANIDIFYSHILNKLTQQNRIIYKVLISTLCLSACTDWKQPCTCPLQFSTQRNHHHHHVHEGLGVFPVPSSSR
jgi:hypothetical protein